MYEVEYVYGKRHALSTNIIEENMFAQTDEEGKRQVILDKITGHRFDEVAVKSRDTLVTTSSGTKCRRQTIQGVGLCIRWR